MSETTMPSDLRAHREHTVGLFAGVDVARFDGRQAARALREVAAIKHAAAALEGVLARRIDETNTWVRDGHRSAAHAVAAATGTSVGQATSTLQTAERLEHLGRTAEAFAKGKLSPAQAAEIGHAASEVPDAEDELLLKVRDERFAPFKDRCRRIAASARDPLEQAKRIRANRSCRTWTDAEGAWNLSARGTPADGGRIMAALGAEADTVFKAARARGDRDPLDAYRFDALRNLVTQEGGSATTSGPTAHVHVNVDAEALLSVKGMPGATCEIPGLGAIPVEDARAMLGDALLTVIIKKGVDVTTVAHHGRTIPTAIRRAVEARDPQCVVDGCTARDQLDLHHIIPWVDQPVTTVDGVVRICHWEHYLVTHCGYTLEPLGDGAYRLVSPDEPERGPP
jgi:hypothetical protein